LNFLQAWNFWRLSRALAAGLNPVLTEYRTQIIHLQTLRDEEEEVLANEFGAKPLNVGVEALKAKGESLRQFLKPVGGRRIGVPGAQLALLLESLRTAINPGAVSLWKAIEPQVEFLRADGQPRSSALLVQALLITDSAVFQDDPQLVMIIEGLKLDIEAARHDPNPERLSHEVVFTAELIGRSRWGNLPSLTELLKPLEPVAEAQRDQVILVGQKLTGTTLIKALIQDAHAAGLNMANLKLLETVLLSRSPAESNGNLQQLLARTALPKASLQATLVGERGVAEYVGSVITGRVEVKEIQLGKQKMFMPMPVVGNVFTHSEKEIDNLAQSPRVSLTWYQGQLPGDFNTHRDFQKDIVRYLGKATLFRGHLATGGAWARAHASWKDKPADMNNQQMARVGITMMIYCARKLSAKEITQDQYDEALEALNKLFAEAEAFKGKAIGRLGETAIYAPASLSYGGKLHLAWLWSRHSRGEDFNLNSDLEKTLREQRLKHLSVASAA
jgi:hypothetical protein